MTVRPGNLWRGGVIEGGHTQVQWMIGLGGQVELLCLYEETDRQKKERKTETSKQNDKQTNVHSDKRTYS